MLRTWKLPGEDTPEAGRGPTGKMHPQRKKVEGVGRGPYSSFLWGVEKTSQEGEKRSEIRGKSESKRRRGKKTQQTVTLSPGGHLSLGREVSLKGRPREMGQGKPKRRKVRVSMQGSFSPKGTSKVRGGSGETASGEGKILGFSKEESSGWGMGYEGYSKRGLGHSRKGPENRSKRSSRPSGGLCVRLVPVPSRTSTGGRRSCMGKEKCPFIGIWSCPL